MKAIIPVAGQGTRLRPHTYVVPKVLVSVAGKPILGHILDKLTENGVDEVILTIGYLGEQVVEYVKHHYGCRVFYAKQEEMLGLGHAIHLTRKYVGTDPCMIVYGDTIFEADLSKIVGASSNYIGIKEVEDPRRFGVVTHENGKVTRFVEKADPPISNLAIVGVNHIVDTEMLFEALEELIRTQKKTKGEYQLTDALQMILTQGADMRIFEVDGWFDCGKPETLLSTNHALLKRIKQAAVRDGNIIVPPVYIPDSAKITHSVIGPDVTVDQGAEIERSIISNSIIGARAVVKDIVLKDSIIGPAAEVRGQFCRLNVGDSSQIEFR